LQNWFSTVDVLARRPIDKAREWRAPGSAPTFTRIDTKGSFGIGEKSDSEEEKTIEPTLTAVIDITN
jgi:hypothetical protein